jgi:hypothetical protein
VEPRGPSFFNTLVEDNLRARYVQDISTFEYSGRLEKLAGFFRDQRWMHMHQVLRSQGITLKELGRRGCGGALASIEAQGFTEEDGTRSASTKFSRRGGKAKIEAFVASLEADGITRIEALRAIGLRLRGGALASLEAQGFMGKGGAASASTELARRGGEARSAIYRKSGNCIYPGCTYAISNGELYINHYQPIKAKKSDKCRVCERVLGVNEKVRGGVCSPCYQKPEAIAARKKATAEKKATRGSCSTPGCKGVNFRGRGKCEFCSYPNKYK